MKRKKINYQLLLRRVCLIVLDIFLIILSSLMALATRFEFDVRQIPEEFFSVLLDYGVLMIFVTLIVFGVFRIYSSLWEYAGLEETFKIIGAVVFSSLCDMAIVVGMGKHLPRSYYVIRTFYLIALVGGSACKKSEDFVEIPKETALFNKKEKKDHADRGRRSRKNIDPGDSEQSISGSENLLCD